MDNRYFPLLNSELVKIAKSLTVSSSVYSNIVSQMNDSVRNFPVINEGLIKQMANDQAIFHSTTGILNQVCQIKGISPNIQALTEVNTSLTQMLKSVSFNDSFFSKIFKDQQHIHDSIKEIAISNSLNSALARVDTTRMLSASLLAQAKLASFDGLSLGLLAGVDTSFSNTLIKSFGNFTQSYKSLIDATKTRESLATYAQFITTYSPIEYCREIEVLESITIEREATEGNDEVIIKPSFSDVGPSVDVLLQKYDERLYPLLQGARDSLKTDNPDRARHVTTSVRELFTQVLFSLASDSDIKNWSTNEKDFHNKRPTRRARLLFICRDINSDPMTRFVEDDIRAALSFLDSLNAGTHVVKSKLTEYQLSSIVSRMESLLVFLLQLRNIGEG